jgi:general secretion pathway protein D
MINRQRLAILMLVTALSLPVYADRAKDEFTHGLQAEHKTEYDAAFAHYKQAYTLAPNNAKYFAAYTRLRFNVAMQHVHSGQMLRNTGGLTQALAEFQQAVAIDSSSFIAQQEVRNTADLIRRRERVLTVPKIESPLANLVEGTGQAVELQPLPNTTVTLRVTANADTVYKTICKLAGINVLTDPDYKAQKISIDLADVTLREALDMVRLQSKTFWRPITPNTILIAAESPNKRKEYEESVMKTFYLRNITTAAELQEAANLVRQVLDVSRVQLLTAQYGLILRGTWDQLTLAEKLLADFDKPKPEVVIDVAVMEVSRDKIRTLGTNLPTTASFGLLPPGSGGSTAAGGAGYTFGSFSVSVSGGSFTFLASDSNTKLLQNPEIRTLNDEKATLRIGDRVPIATGSFQPGVVGGSSVSPLVSTQFPYLDVGVNIDITPHIHSNSEVTLKMALEISSVSGTETIGGITEPIIGQRRIEHSARLADGEVNLLGGILEDSETQSLSGYPWLSRLPILKYLFAQDNRENRETEIVFAITPHIVRAQDVTEENSRAIEVGTGGSIELHRKPSAPATPGTKAPADAAKPKPPAPQTQPSKAPAGS